MKQTAATTLLLLSVAACDRADQAPQDSHSGKAPTGMIDPGPGAPSRERASSPEPTTGTAGTGSAGVAGSAGGGSGGGASGGNAGTAGAGGSAGTAAK